MKITPIEIKQQKFEKSLRGFDVAEVQQFLILISNEYENLLNKNKDLEEQIEKLSERVKHYEKVEEALHETLQTTKESIAHKMENARLEAKNLVDKSHFEAEKIISAAHREKASIRQSILRLLDKREEIIGGISSYLETAFSSVNKFKDDEMRVFTLNEETTELETTKNMSKFTFDVEAEMDVNNLNSDMPGSDRLDDILDEID